MALIKSGSTATYMDVDANHNARVNSYYAAPDVTLGTFGVTTTLAAVGGRINVTGFKYIKVFVSSTMSTNSKDIGIGIAGSPTVSGNLYPVNDTSSSGADIFSVDRIGTDINNAVTASGIYTAGIRAANGTGLSGTSKGSGTDYVIRLSGAVKILGLVEIQFYAQHDDTGTINTTIDYVLSNT
jgi:hypothetical protein